MKPPFLKGQLYRTYRMAMSQGERMSRLQQESVNYVSRSKVRDSSELTYINQAKASKNYIPQLVIGTQSLPDVQTLFHRSTTVAIKGKGTNMEYTSVLQAKQGCAVCSDVDPAINRGIYIPSVVYDHSLPPFAQQHPSTMYTPACTPGFNVYLPRRVFDPTGCKYNRQLTPSG